MESKKNEVILADRNYQKSNFLIGGKYKASLLENKITAISLCKLNEAVEDELGNLIVNIKAAELRRIIGGNSGSFYNQLDPVAHTMMGRAIGWSDPEKKEFEYISVITHAMYKDGVFSVEFNHHLKHYIQDIKENFTLLQLGTMMKFKSDHSFRLYELLKSKAYYPKGVKGDGIYHIEYGLSELKLQLGIVNANNDKVKRVLDAQKNPDYDRAVEVALERTYDKWGDFNNWVLKKAVKEINETTDMKVSYDKLGAGRGGKVYKVIFHVTFDTPLTKKKLSEEEQMDFIDEISEIIAVRLKLREYRSIAEAAEYDAEKVRRANDYMICYRGQIDNVPGFLISAIKNDYRAVPEEEDTIPSISDELFLKKASN